MTTTAKKFLTVAVSLMVTLVIAEVLLRLFTIYPNTITSNRISDENIGFRASQKIPGVDSEGFRNAEGTPKTIVAIGDSQTFGFNVSSTASWPTQLSRLIRTPIYNFGSGGYGLITYHGLLKLFLPPETKIAIVALYPANDFEQFYATDADCLVLDNPNEFWRSERERLKLEWPAYPVGCLHNDDNSRTGFLQKFTSNIAVISMMRDGFSELFGISRIPSGAGIPGGPEKGIFNFPEGLGRMNVSRVEMHERSTDPAIPEVAAMMKNLPLLLQDWKSMSQKGLMVGVMVLPSRERVIHDYLKRKGRLGEVAPEFANGMSKQIAAEEFVRDTLEKSGLPFVFANEDLYHHLEFSLEKGIPLYPEADNGHPLELGYAAYTSAARRLLGKMGVLSSGGS